MTIVELKGSLTQIKVRVNASGDAVNTASLECFGPVAALHELMKKPLKITLQVMDDGGPFE